MEALDQVVDGRSAAVGRRRRSLRHVGGDLAYVVDRRDAVEQFVLHLGQLQRDLLRKLEELLKLDEVVGEHGRLVKLPAQQEMAPAEIWTTTEFCLDVHPHFRLIDSCHLYVVVSN